MDVDSSHLLDQDDVLVMAGERGRDESGPADPWIGVGFFFPYGKKVPGLGLLSLSC